MTDHTIAVNRRARYEYAIEETVEAGIVLTGTEIKSIRAGHDWGSNAAEAMTVGWPGRVTRMAMLSTPSRLGGMPTPPFPQCQRQWYHWFQATKRGQDAVRRSKRVFDVVVSSLLLVAFAPLFAVATLVRRAQDLKLAATSITQAAVRLAAHPPIVSTTLPNPAFDSR